MSREHATVEDWARATAMSVGMDITELADALKKIRDAARPHYGNPTNELRNRLNARLRGEDPGPPIHWRGMPGQRSGMMLASFQPSGTAARNASTAAA